jgi:AcrR family transcriptional regulator
MNDPMSGKKTTRIPSDNDTIDRLLNTAERLFAERGYEASGVRALAAEAGVNLGAVTYHFGSKEKLYIETFMRHFRPVGASRLELLRRARAKAGINPLPVETIIDCLVRPPILTILKHPHFPALLARNLFIPPPFMQGILEKEMQANLEEFVGELSKALPELPPAELRLRLLLSAGALLMFAGRMRKTTRQTPGQPALLESALSELVRFISAGLRSSPSLRPKVIIPQLFPFLSPRV